MMAAAGLLHRRAAADGWADDRLLSADPAWLQMAAPLWHAVGGNALSIANLLARAIDPLTQASIAGDVRAIAASLAALGAAAALLVLWRAGIAEPMALVLAGALTSLVLPVSSAISIAHALQLLLGACLVLVWLSPRDDRARFWLLAVMTLAGALNHASFVAFAAAIWAIDVAQAGAGVRGRAAAAGTAVLIGSVLMTSWLLQRNIIAPFAIALDRPGTLDLAWGGLTGRFPAVWQPSQSLGLIAASALCLPAPLVMCAPLVLLAFVRQQTRAIAVACGGAAAALIVFAAGSWLPDPTVALAPARLALVILAGLGLSFIAALPVRGSVAMAAAAAVFIGLGRLVEAPSPRVPEETAVLQAFVAAAPPALERAAWTTDHLAVARALSVTDLAVASSRVPLALSAVRDVPDRLPVIAFGDEPAALPEGATFTAPLELPYPSAARFVAALPPRWWLAAASHGPTAGFCDQLLALLGAADAGPDDAPHAVLAAPGPAVPRASLSGSPRLEAPYGTRVDRVADPVPARFTITADRGVSVAVNNQPVAQASQGLALVAFDPWTSATHTWLTGPCATPQLPLIAERRLRAQFLAVGSAGAAARRLPLVATTLLRVALGDSADEWLGQGWHGPEGSGEATYRWTSAPEAQVYVAVAAARPLRIRLTGDLALSAGRVNRLGLDWNGTVIRPLGPWPDGPTGEWTVPATTVQRGLNILTIRVAHTVSPAASGGADGRSLGIAVRALSIEPALRPAVSP